MPHVVINALWCRTLTSSLQILGQMKKKLYRIVTLLDFIRLCDLYCLSARFTNAIWSSSK